MIQEILVKVSDFWPAAKPPEEMPLIDQFTEHYASRFKNKSIPIILPVSKGVFRLSCVCVCARACVRVNYMTCHCKQFNFCSHEWLI